MNCAERRLRTYEAQANVRIAGGGSRLLTPFPPALSVACHRARV